MRDDSHFPTTHDVLCALAKKPTSALNLARHRRWSMAALCEALGILERRTDAERLDGIWHITNSGRRGL